MEDMCPKCGSLDVIEDNESPFMLVCLDCGHKFPAKTRGEKYNEDITRSIYNPYEEEDTDIEEDGLIGEDLGF